MERYVRSVVAPSRDVVVAVLGDHRRPRHATRLRCTSRSAAAPTCPKSHPYVQIQNRISDLFGGEAVVIIGVIASEGDIFTPAMLGKIQRITDRLRDIAERDRVEPVQHRRART